MALVAFAPNSSIRMQSGSKSDFVLPELKAEDVEEQIRNAVLVRRVRTDEYFKDFDRLRTGYITKAQFDRCLDQHYGVILTQLEDSVLMQKYGQDQQHPGMVNYRDFCKVIDTVFGPTSVSPKTPPILADEIQSAHAFASRPLSPASRSKCEDLLQRIALYCKYHGINIKTCYEDFDRHNIGLVTESQFYRCFPGPADVSENEQALLARKYAHASKRGLCNYLIFYQEVDAILQHSDKNQRDCESEGKTMASPKRKSLRDGSDIDSIFDKIRIAVHKNGIRTTEFFKDHDKLRSGVITKNQFVCGITLCCATHAGLTRDDIDTVVQHYSTEDGRVRYKEFCDLMENAFNVPHLEKKPTTDVYRPPVGALGKVPVVLDGDEEERVQIILAGLRDTVKKKRLMLYPYFKDFHRGICYTRVITRTQFARMLHMVGLTVPEAHLDLLCRKFEYPATADVNYPAFIQEVDAEYCGTADVTGSWNTTSYISKEEDDDEKERPYQHTSSIDVDDLIARIRHDVLVNRVRLEEFFLDFDPLRHGSISKTRFRMGLSAMGQDQLTDAQFNALQHRYADAKRKGNVVWTSFLTDIEKVFTERHLEKHPQTKLQPPEAFYMPKPGACDWHMVPQERKDVFDAAMQRMRLKTSQRRILAKPCFQDFDRHNHGYVTKSQFRQCITYLSLDATPDEMDVVYEKFADSMGFNYLRFLEELQPSEKQEIKYWKRLEELKLINERKTSPTRASGDITFVMDKIKTQVGKQAVRVHEFMKDYDKLRTGRMLKTSFPRAINLCNLELLPAEVETIMEWFSSPGYPDYVDYNRFCDDVETVFTQKGLEKNPAMTVERFVPNAKGSMQSLSPEAEEMLEAVMHRLGDRVRLRRIQLFPLFEDYDRVHNGTVSRTQFHRVLSELEIGSLVSAREFQVLYEKFDSVIGGKHDFNYIGFCDMVNSYAKFEYGKP